MENGPSLPVWLILLLCFQQIDSDWLSCGQLPVCLCKWSSGKKTASCLAGNLKQIPHLSPDIQVLDLNGNPLKTLEKDAFASIGLLNLQRLNLSSTNLSHLHADTFRELRILVELDLSQNELLQLSPDTFRGNERLRLLVLNDNPLKTLVEKQFPILQHLKRLEIARCRLEHVHSLAFVNLKSLEAIYAHENLLTHLHQDTFNLPLLKTLTLSENPWNCDCRLKGFYSWFLTRNFGSEDVFCRKPNNIAKQSWRDLKESEMVCAPKVSVEPPVIRTEVGADIYFGCIARGDPTPVISWTHNDANVHNGSLGISKIQVNLYQSRSTDKYNDNNFDNATQWLNISISNVTSEFAGEWTCKAKSLAGEAKGYLTLVLPKARIATARIAPDYSAFLAVAGSIAVMTASGFIAACLCWKTRRRRMPPSRSFTDQEKKLLDTSLAVSLDRNSADLGSSYNFEMLNRSNSMESGDSQRCLEPVQITIEGPHCGFLPPPAEFAVPAPYGNIFISVQVRGANEQYPDLLGGSATLPRRSKNCLLKSDYDNMGPRVTAAGSSVWSLPDSNTDNCANSGCRSNGPEFLLSTFSTEFTAL